MSRFFFFLLLVFAACGKDDQPPQQDAFIRGADMSFLPEVRAAGLQLTGLDGKVEDMLITLKNAGVNTIRLRLWKDPVEKYASLSTVKSIADEAHRLGLNVMLTIHYSDTWADPAHQQLPAAWTGLSLPVLADSLAAYTRQAVQAIQPELVQIGNEINNGLCWPQGHISDTAAMLTLLRSGISAVRSTAPAARVILHYAGLEGAETFFGALRSTGYDLIGLSYYPIWHGRDLDRLASIMDMLTVRYHKPVLIAETSYPFTLAWADQTHNVVGEAGQLLPAFSATPAGQAAYLLQIKNIALSAKQGAGFCYWGSEWVAYKGAQATNGSSWENQALWDFQHKALPALTAFKK